MPAEITLSRHGEAFARVFRPIVKTREFVDLHLVVSPEAWFAEEVSAWLAETGMPPPRPTLLCMKPVKGVKGVLLAFAREADMLLFKVRWL